MKLHDYEIPFFKVWRNKFLVSNILFYIKNQKSDQQYCYEHMMVYNGNNFSNQRLDYDDIDSLGWIIDNCGKDNVESILKDKLKSNSYIHISKSCISKFISKCKTKSTFQLLWKYKRNELERIGLLEESVKLDKVFSLDVFIELYGGPQLVVSERIGDHYSLLVLALKYKSFKVARYLHKIDGLNGSGGNVSSILESQLKHIEMVDNYNGYIVNEPNCYSINLEEIKERLSIQSEKLKEKLKLLQKDSIEYNLTNIELKLQVKYKNQLDLQPTTNGNGNSQEKESKTDKIIEFIENELKITNCLDYSNLLISSTISNGNKLKILIARGNSYRSRDFKGIEIIDDKKFHCDYRENGNCILKLVLFNKSILGSHQHTIEYLSKLFSSGHQYNDTKLLLEKFGSSLPEYSLDYNYFTKNSISDSGVKANSRILIHYTTLSLLNFCNGFIYALKPQYTDKNDFWSQLLIEIASISDQQFFKRIQQTSISIELENNIVSFFQGDINNPIISKREEIWDALFKILLIYYPSSCLKTLLEINNFKTNFSKNSNTLFNYWKNISILNFKYDLQMVKLIIKYSNQQVSTSPIQLYFNDINQRISFYNHFIQVQSDHEIKSLLFNNQLPPLFSIIIQLTNGIDNLKDSIEFYNGITDGTTTSLSDHVMLDHSLNNGGVVIDFSKIFEINSSSKLLDLSIINYSLESLLFDHYLVQLIKNNDLNGIIEILSIVNGFSSEIKAMSLCNLTMVSIVNFIESNGWLVKFGKNTIVLLVQCILENEIQFTKQVEIIQTIGNLLKSFVPLQVKDMVHHLIYLSIRFKLDMVTCYLLGLIKSKNCDYQSLSLEFNENKYQMVIEFMKQLESKTKPWVSSSNEIKNNTLFDKSLLLCLNGGSDDHSMLTFLIDTYPSISFSQQCIKRILKLLCRYCNIETFINVYENILRPLKLLQNQDELITILSKCNYFMNRFDLFQFILENITTTTDSTLFKSFIMQVFENGNLKIIKYLFQYHFQLFDDISPNQLCPNNICTQLLLNGHIECFKFVIKQFKLVKYTYQIVDTVLYGIIKSDYSNVLDYLYNSNQLDRDTFNFNSLPSSIQIIVSNRNSFFLSTLLNK